MRTRPVTRTGLELLLGQTADLNLTMVVTGVAVDVTVTGQAPLLELTQSSLGGNINPQQMQELPVQGRKNVRVALTETGYRRAAGGIDVALAVAVEQFDAFASNGNRHRGIGRAQGGVGIRRNDRGADG